MMELSKKTEALQKEVLEVVISHSDSSGQVTANFNGMGLALSVQVSDALLSKGAEAASRATTEAVVEGQKKSQQYYVQRLSALYQESGLPGMMGGK